MKPIAFHTEYRHKDGMTKTLLPSFLTLPFGAKLAYHQHIGDTSKPGIIFMGGLMSDMTGTKATALEAHCKANNLSFIRFDYQGHGQSSGQFTEGNIGLWASDALAIFDALTNPDQKQIIIGSSMGGWMMLLTALARKETIHGLIGIAAAPDFPEKLMWQKLEPAQQAELKEKGIIYLPNDYGEPYPIRLDFIEESRQHVLLDGDIALDCPIRLLHGMADPDVPYRFSGMIAQAVTSTDVDIHLIKDGDHSLSREEDIEKLLALLDGMV